MNMDISPATEVRPPRAPSSRISPTTSTEALGIPQSPEAADRLLSYAERLLRDGRMPNEYVSQLASFLGANSAAWTNLNRDRLRKALVSIGTAVIESVAVVMSRFSRTDILDEGEFVLRALPRGAAPTLRSYLDFDHSGITASVRAAILRAVARLDPRGSLSAIHVALSDPDSEVRDTAASLLGEFGDETSRRILTKRLEHESDQAVIASIREAIESIQA